MTQILGKCDAVQLKLLTVDVATLVDGMSTRYRAELNVKLPGIDTMTPEDVKKAIEPGIANHAIASVVESKTIETGMSPEEVKKSLRNRDKLSISGQAGLRIQRHEGTCSQQLGFGRSVGFALFRRSHDISKALGWHHAHRSGSHAVWGLASTLARMVRLRVEVYLCTYIDRTVAGTVAMWRGSVLCPFQASVGRVG